MEPTDALMATTVCDKKWKPSMFLALDRMRRNLSLCDVILRGRDDQDHPAHQVVLASVSSLFAGIIDMNCSSESGGEDKSKNTLIIEMDANEELVDAFLDYVYSGTVQLRVSRKEEFLDLCQQFGLESYGGLSSMLSGATASFIGPKIEPSSDPRSALEKESSSMEGGSGKNTTERRRNGSSVPYSSLGARRLTTDAESDEGHIFRCGCCSKPFGLLSRLKYHAWHVHMDRLKAAHESQSLEESEQDSATKENYHTCVVCLKPFANADELIEHEKLAHPTWRTTKRWQTAQSRKLGPARKGKSEKGSLGGGKKGALKMTKFSSRQRAFSCTSCPATFAGAGSLARHRRLEHGRDKTPPVRIYADPAIYANNRQVMCQTCGQHMPYKKFYGYHKRQCAGLDPASGLWLRKKAATCTVCGRSFDGEHAVRKHMLKHTDEKPEQCDICGGRFRSLGYHRTLHTKKKKVPTATLR